MDGIKGRQLQEKTIDGITGKQTVIEKDKRWNDRKTDSYRKIQ